MRPFLSSLCFALSLAGCATSSPQQPAPGESVLQINAEGGNYYEFNTATAADPTNISVDLTIEGINPDPEWGPRAGLCLHSTSSDQQACVHLGLLANSATALQATRALYKAQGVTLVSREAFPGTYSVGSKVRIGIRLGTDSVAFKVGDGTWQMLALPDSSKSVQASCSSALCTLRMH